MHEQSKVDEARYFLERMTKLPEPMSFRFELSAFLSASRSALQYALEEAAAKVAWYDGQISGKHVVRFLKDKRNINVHRQPVVPRTKASVELIETVRMSDAIQIRVINTKGEIIQEVSVGDQPSPSPPPVPPVITYSYNFADWNGPEDVLTLSNQYLTEVEAIIRDGVANGFLTP